jgi:hypothetical protein
MTGSNAGANVRSVAALVDNFIPPCSAKSLGEIAWQNHLAKPIGKVIRPKLLPASSRKLSRATLNKKS